MPPLQLARKHVAWTQLIISMPLTELGARDNKEVEMWEILAW